MGVPPVWVGDLPRVHSALRHLSRELITPQPDEATTCMAQRSKFAQ
jgi:hypothetical protein